MQLTAEHQLILGILSSEDPATSARLQAATGKSQPTVSRLIADLGSQVQVMGRARATRYGLGKSIHGRPSQHALWWTDEQGARVEVGTLTFLANDSLHVHSQEFGDFAGTSLPWYLSPLRAEGFLGRLAARSMAALGADAEPDRWSLETVLYAALQVHDAPGAMTLGVQDSCASPLRLAQGALLEALDAAAAQVATTLPAGSSAGGEQPKFLAVFPEHVIVKFTPPIQSPGGRRWSDLLHAEQLANQTLHEQGFGAARSRVVRTAQRTYLISERFDRIGLAGRRHVVAIGKAHEAFVQGGYRNWVETSRALASRGFLSSRQAEAVSIIRDFGRLIGNTDMHSGNLGLFVALDGVRRGRFELAPVYDMLPMRWRPDPLQGGVQEYTPFAPENAALASRAAPLAEVFWSRLAECDGASDELRRVAADMTKKLRRQATPAG